MLVQSSGGYIGFVNNTATGYANISIDDSGSGTPHAHEWTGNAINLAVAYVDLILASKD
jgi:hypothetical protein